MRSNKQSVRTAILLAAVGSGVWAANAPLHAGGGESHPCAAVVGASERLACYDQAFPPNADPAAVEAKARENFGRDMSSVTSTALDGAPSRLDARVSEVRPRAGGGRLFILDDGQVWGETQSNVLGTVRSGDEVQLKKGSFGSYFLVTASGVSLRVKRIQ